MAELKDAASIIRFGVYEVDGRACELRRAGQRVPLQIQPFRVLEALVARAGEVVTRAELREQVWPSTVFVDFDAGLNNAIARLRHALGDSADEPRYIETLPRVGYRFIHSIEPGATEEPMLLQSHSAVAEPWPARHRRTVAMASVVMMALVVAVGAWVAAPGRSARNDAMRETHATVNRDAYDAYRRGLELFERRNKEATRLSIEQLTQAVEIDPGFAAAYAALAVAYTGAGGDSAMRFMTAEQALEHALPAAERALRIDPKSAEAHLALARVLDALQPRSPATDVAIDQAYQRSFELDPELANAHLFYGNYLSKRGRSEDAVVQFRRALELDPLSPSVNSRLGMELLGLGRMSEGFDYLQATVELDPWQYNARVRLGWAHIGRGDLDAARREFETAETISPESARSLSGLAYVAAQRGDMEQAHALLEKLLRLAETFEASFDVAVAYVGLNDRENALSWLARAARQTRTLQALAPWGIRAPIYDWLRDDARFVQIERDVMGEASVDRATEPSL